MLTTIIVALVALAAGALAARALSDARRRASQCRVVLRFAECKAGHLAEMPVDDPARLLPAVQPIVVEEIDCPVCFVLARAWQNERAAPRDRSQARRPAVDRRPGAKVAV